jgi:hypothetical protein
MKQKLLFSFVLFLAINISSCKKLCMHCSCNFNTDEKFEEEDCTQTARNEGEQLFEYESELKAEKGYTYCDCYGVKK